MASIAKYLADRDYASEVLLVDDGSADDTAKIAREAFGEGLRVLTQTPNQGKGAAIRRGMEEARGDWRLFSDADNSTPIDEIEKLWPWADEGYDVCVGSRAMRESRIEVRQPFYRETMGRTFNVFVRALVLGGLSDTQCGFKLFSRAAAEAVFPRQSLSGWAFDVECLMLARGSGFRIREVPIRWINSPATRLSAMSDSIAMFRDLLRLRSMYGKDGARLKPNAI